MGLFKDEVKENFIKSWEAKDEHCPYCNQITKENRGASKANLKKLIFAKPTLYEWTILFIIVMVLFMAWRYNMEVEECQKAIKEPFKYCDRIQKVIEGEILLGEGIIGTMFTQEETEIALVKLLNGS